MNVYKLAATVFVLMVLNGVLFAQGYKLVWADEFDGTQLDLSNWTRETGGDGWGNNELEYYTDRTVNANVAGGMLTITAMSEAYGGKNYTSARLKTQGKRSFKYGKIEARIKLPYGQGIWPAFWMLGDNITTAGWPACGETDIMELIGGGAGRDNRVYGTGHWDNNGHQSYGLNYTLPTGNFSDDFHRFSIAWEPEKTVWYVDDIKYCTLDITPESLSEFRASSFIILNLAVGGNWPGNPNTSTVFPQQMQVDYVRAYKDTLAEPTAVLSAPVENAVFQPGDEITIAADVSSGDAVKMVEFYQDAVKIGETNVKPYQIKWKNVQAGCYQVKVNVITERGFNAISNVVNIKVGAECGKGPYKGYLQKIPGKIEAENFDNGGNNIGYYDSDVKNTGGSYRPSESVDLQPCTDIGGGYNVGWITTNEWLSYSVIATETTNYNFEFRLASAATAGSDLLVLVDDVEISGLVHVANTGGLQAWTTVTKSNVPLSAGAHNLKFLFKTAGFNFNYVNVVKSAKPTYIQVLSPNGGEKLQAGTVAEIAWESSKVDRVKIGLSKDNGTNWSLVTSDCAAEFGTFRFVVPEVFSDQCRIMIVDKSNSAMSDVSDAAFSIAVAPAGISNATPKTYALKLYPSYPNPSNPETKIRFTIAHKTNSETAVKLSVYDINGRLVSTPVNANYPNGTHEILLSNKGLASGIYELILMADNQVERTKMVVLK